MTALQDDELSPYAIDEWNLPRDREGFLAFLRDAGVTPEEFKGFDAFPNMPPELRKVIYPSDY